LQLDRLEEQVELSILQVDKSDDNVSF